MPTPTFAPGHDLVGRYRITRLLGIGHVAEAYLADDLSLRREIVVKVLLGHLAAYEDVRRAFRDRIVRSATLSHPHLERVFDGGQESGHIFMITEYLEGGSFEEVLASGQRLSLDDTARLGRDVAGALAYLQRQRLRPRGALAANTLLFDAEGRVRVTDVALVGAGRDARRGADLDEVRYLSPEQALGEPRGRAQRRLRARAHPLRGGHGRVALRGDDPRGDAAHAGQHAAAGASRAGFPRHGPGPGRGPGPSPATRRRAVREPPRGVGRRLVAAHPAPNRRAGAAAGPVHAERAAELDRVPPALARPDRRRARGAPRLPRRRAPDGRAARPRGPRRPPRPPRAAAAPAAGAPPGRWGSPPSCWSSWPSPRGRCGSSACSRRTIPCRH